MLPLTQLPTKKIRAVFTDLDDTLTENGQISSHTYQALHALHMANYKLVVVSGRPGGWADCLMRLWPLDAMIFENGAGYFLRNEDGGFEMVPLYKGLDQHPPRERLEAVFQRVLKEVPNAKLASDQPYRLLDYAIDFCEDPPRLSDAELETVLKVLGKEKDVTFKLSSIHVNYWLGTHTKVTACEKLLVTLKEKWGLLPENCLYSGDSPNDEPLFDFFEHSVGVANILDFSDRLEKFPQYITENRGGNGFQEIVSQLLTTGNSHINS